MNRHHPEDDPAAVSLVADEYGIPAAQSLAARCATILDKAGWRQKHRPTMAGAWVIAAQGQSVIPGASRIDLNFGPGGELEALKIAGHRQPVPADVLQEVRDHVNAYPATAEED